MSYCRENIFKLTLSNKSVAKKTCKCNNFIALTLLWMTLNFEILNQNQLSSIIIIYSYQLSFLLYYDGYNLQLCTIFVKYYVSYTYYTN